MRVDGLFLMNEGPERKRIPVSSQEAAGFLVGPYLTTVLHPTPPENRMKYCGEKRDKAGETECRQQKGG